MASWSADKTEVVVCPHCGAKNQILTWYKPVDLPTKCHKCRKIFYPNQKAKE